MRVRVKFFALAKELSGRESVELELPAGAVLGQLRPLLAAEIGAIAPLVGSMSFAVDAEYSGDDLPLSEGVSVACILPVSGG